MHVFQNFYENCKEYEESLNQKAISIQIYKQMCNLLYRRLVEVLEHFTERPQRKKSFGDGRLPFALRDVFFALKALNSIA